MPSLFTKIIQGEIPCHKVWEDDDHLAFLDINPIRPGHTLVIPKKEIAYIFDMEEEAYAALWQAARKVAKTIKQTLGCQRVCIDVVGWEVPHVHVHLIPTNTIHDYPVPPKQSPTQDQLAAIARQLIA